MNSLKVLFLMTFITLSAVQTHDHGNFTHVDFFSTLTDGDKAALLMVHFGTTHADTRSYTIDVLNQKAKEAFPELEVREAWTSQIVMRRMKERGVEMADPVTALNQLKAEGYTHVLIQSSNIIEGIEMESLRREVADIRPEFEEIRIGNPLLYTPEDYEAVIEALASRFTGDKAVVLVGHGTYTPATAQYGMLDYMLKTKGYNHVHVGTIEGFPAFEEVVNQLEATGTKEILLLPFMFVAGDHAKNDIAGDWKEELEEKGYEVTVLLEGLGQNAGIQEIFMDHIRFVMGHKMQDIREKKREYAQGKDKHSNRLE